MAWYQEQFTPDPRQPQLGEATPSYLYDAEARARLVETLPDTKVVVILRDPIKRAIIVAVIDVVMPPRCH